MRRNSWFVIIDNHVKNRKYGNFVSVSCLESNWWMRSTKIKKKTETPALHLRREASSEKSFNFPPIPWKTAVSSYVWDDPSMILHRGYVISFDIKPRALRGCNLPEKKRHSNHIAANRRLWRPEQVRRAFNDETTPAALWNRTLKRLVYP